MKKIDVFVSHQLVKLLGSDLELLSIFIDEYQKIPVPNLLEQLKEIEFIDKEENIREKLEKIVEKIVFEQLSFVSGDLFNFFESEVHAKERMVFALLMICISKDPSNSVDLHDIINISHQLEKKAKKDQNFRVFEKYDILEFIHTFVEKNLILQQFYVGSRVFTPFKKIYLMFWNVMWMKQQKIFWYEELLEDVLKLEKIQFPSMKEIDQYFNDKKKNIK